IALSEQDPQRWIAPMIDEAERELAAAGKLSHIGRFQLEAAIQSVHADRMRTGGTDWPSIALLYEGLVRISPTLGARVGRAAAVAEVSGAVAGLALLDAIDAQSVAAYQPYWAVRAHVLRQAGCDATAAFDRAIELADDPAVKVFLRERRDARDTETK
ncbi:MAG TPA: hypothetical protein VIZ30_04245, partial [Pseudomonadales bacterium]